MFASYRQMSRNIKRLHESSWLFIQCFLIILRVYGVLIILNYFTLAAFDDHKYQTVYNLICQFKVKLYILRCSQTQSKKNYSNSNNPSTRMRFHLGVYLNCFVSSKEPALKLLLTMFKNGLRRVPDHYLANISCVYYVHTWIV
jgi:hypothetical protein